METTFLKKLGQKIKSRRLEKSLSQEKLAFASDVSSDYLGKIELGKVNPSVFVVNRIAKALGVDLSELVRGL